MLDPVFTALDIAFSVPREGLAFKIPDYRYTYTIEQEYHDPHTDLVDDFIYCIHDTLRKKKCSAVYILDDILNTQGRNTCYDSMKRCQNNYVRMMESHIHDVKKLEISDDFEEISFNEFVREKERITNLLNGQPPKLDHYYNHLVTKARETDNHLYIRDIMLKAQSGISLAYIAHKLGF
jgi:hypothetical protein